MAENHDDVKTGDDSSKSLAPAGNEQQKGGMDDSPTSENDSQLDVKSGVSMADFVKQGLDKQTGEESAKAVTEGDVEEKESDPKIGLDEEKKEEKAGGEKEDATKSEEKTEKKDEVVEGKPVPYERFKEIIDEKNALKQKIESEYIPKAKNFDSIQSYCQNEGISPENFQKALQAQAILSKVENGLAEPSEALKVLEPIIAALKGMTGDVLPQDLQAKVDAGKMELEDAKEFAQLRAKTKFGEAGMKRQQQTMQQRQQQEFQAQCETAADQWDAGKRASDPDYKPKSKDSEPDGKFEMVRDKYLAMLNMTNSQGQYANPIKTPQQMSALMEKAYQAVDATFKGVFNKKPPTRKVLSSNGSSGTSTTDEPGDQSMAAFIAKSMGSKGRR